MKVLVACEESQRVCIAFREKGHEAYSCDIMDCSGGHPEWHIRGDVLPLLHPKWYELNQDGEGNQWEGYKFQTVDGKTHQFEGKWDLIIAHPPCTYMSKAGARFMYLTAGNVNQERLEKALQAKEFFMQFVNADCDKICIENPIGYPNTHYRKPNQIIQPWQFGHPFTKATCLWLKGLEPLKPFVTEKPQNCKSYAWETMIDERGKTISWNSELSRKLRSKTFDGIAKAMAEQWG